MAYIPFEFVTHARKVRALYKKACRDVDAKHLMPYLNVAEGGHMARYHRVLMRNRFDKNKDIKDPILAKRLLEEGEEEYMATASLFQITYPNSYNGTLWETVVEIPDDVLDFWHPLEKARYPKYFARREQLKKEYVEMYDKKYGKNQDEGWDYH